MKKGVILAIVLFMGLFFITNADVPAAAVASEDSTLSSESASSGSWFDTIKSFFVYSGEKKEKEPEKEKEEISGTALARDIDKKQDEEKQEEKKEEKKEEVKEEKKTTEDPEWINEEATGDDPFDIVIYDELTILDPDEYTMEEEQQQETVQEETGVLIGSSAIGAYYSGEASYNVQLAVDYHKGIYIPAGGMYSAFNILGDGGADMGFHAAPGLLSDGSTAMMYGSGICPVTTAIYQAARNSGLDVLEVNDHVGAESAYAAAGDQAMFNYPDSDLKIQNNNPYGVTLYMGYYDGIIYAEWYGDYYEEY